MLGVARHLKKLRGEFFCIQEAEGSDGGGIPFEIVAGLKNFAQLGDGAGIAHGGKRGDGLLDQLGLGHVLDGVGITVANSVAARNSAS